MEPHMESRTLVLMDVNNDEGTMRREVRLDTEGGLSLIGHDLGPGVQQFFGFDEYEFTRHLNAQEVVRLRELLGIDAAADLLARISEQFDTSHEFEAYLSDEEIPGRFWSRIGD